MEVIVEAEIMNIQELIMNSQERVNMPMLSPTT